MLIFDSFETATLYALAKRVAHILKLPLTLHSTLAPGLRRIKAKDPEHHKYDNVPPEVALMATIIIVVKMTYGLDGKPRYWLASSAGRCFDPHHADFRITREIRRWHFPALIDGWNC